MPKLSKVYRGLSAVFSTPKFFIVVRSYMQGKMQSLLKRSKYFFVNQSGLSLLEVAVVLIIIGILLLGVISKGQSVIAESHLNATCQNISNIVYKAGEYISRCDAETLTDGGKTIFSKLQESGDLDRNAILSKDGDRECMKFSAINAKAFIKNDHHTWCVWLGPLGSADAKKMKDKLSAEIMCENARVDNIEQQMHVKDKKYHVVVKIFGL
jgi:prepilin-type N-terminal cleavage/methylation domain-containing protein